jgi:hypothetical protein
MNKLIRMIAFAFIFAFATYLTLGGIYLLGFFADYMFVWKGVAVVGFLGGFAEWLGVIE